jgi:hypothetical protein
MQWYTSQRMSRRATAIAIAIAIVCAVAAAAWRHSCATRVAGGPLILISIDTLRADHLPVYGYTKVRTPAIDALASTSTQIASNS